MLDWSWADLAKQQAFHTKLSPTLKEKVVAGVGVRFKRSGPTDVPLTVLDPTITDAKRGREI